MVKLVSTTYRGEWPAGVYWEPGEVREVPTVDGAPVGVDLVAPPKASPGKSATAPGKAK